MRGHVRYPSTAVIVALSLCAHSACDSRTRNPSKVTVEGAWRSDEALTWRSFRTVQDRLSEGQRRIWLAPGFFGKMYLVFKAGRWTSVYDGECFAVGDFQLSAQRDGVVKIRAQRDGGDMSVMELVDGTLRTSIGNGKFPALEPAREVFVPVSIEEVERRFPCLESSR